MKQVMFFNELKKDQQPMAGGKGGTLARLYQAGFTAPIVRWNSRRKFA